MTRARKFLQVTRAQNYGVSCRKIGWAHAILWRHFFPIGSRWLMQFSDTTHPLAKKSNFPTTTTDESIVQLWSCTKRIGGFGSQRKTPKVATRKKWSILGKKCISHYINFLEVHKIKVPFLYDPPFSIASSLCYQRWKSAKNWEYLLLFSQSEFLLRA